MKSIYTIYISIINFGEIQNSNSDVLQSSNAQVFNVNIFIDTILWSFSAQSWLFDASEWDTCRRHSTFINA